MVQDLLYAVFCVASTCVDEVLDCQARSRRDAGVGAGRARDGQVRGDHCLAVRRDDRGCGAARGRHTVVGGS